MFLCVMVFKFKKFFQTAFLSLTRPSSNGERANGATLTWRDLSVYVTAPSESKTPFKRVLNNGAALKCLIRLIHFISIFPLQFEELCSLDHWSH